MKKLLVIYYSRTGYTRKVAEALANALDADLEELKEVKRRDGWLGYIGAALDALGGRSSKLKELQHDPTRYDLVIMGTPVWASKPVSAVRTFITKYNQSIKHFALFCTMGGSGGVKALDAVEDLTGRAAVARMVLTDKQIDSSCIISQVRDFVSQIRPRQ